MEKIRETLQQTASILQTFLSDDRNIRNIHEAGLLLAAAIANGNKIISCGNGGSMSDAMHFAEELSGKFRNDRRPLPAISIADPSYISCVANDYGWEAVFSRYIEAIGKEGDVLLAISTSGNSANIIKAAESAKLKGMKIVGLTGKTGGYLTSLCDVEIRAPESEFSDRAQEIHIKVIHILIEFIEREVL